MILTLEQAQAVLRQHLGEVWRCTLFAADWPMVWTERLRCGCLTHLAVHPDRGEEITLLTPVPGYMPRVTILAKKCAANGGCSLMRDPARLLGLLVRGAAYIQAGGDWAESTQEG